MGENNRVAYSWTPHPDDPVSKMTHAGVAMCAHLELLLRQLEVEGIKVALDVGHACCLGDNASSVLNGPSDQDLHIQQKLTQRSQFLYLKCMC